jgi:hypothetical protein
MPLACSSAASALSGADGLVTFKPAGVKACLLDNTDFSAGQDINVPAGNGFRLGDAIKFTEAGTGKIDTALTAGTTYYVVKVGSGTMQVSASNGGTAITLNGDGGLGGPSGGVVSGTLTPVTTLPTVSGNYGAGPYTGVATTTTGGGSGLTVDVTVATNNVTAIVVNAGGAGYKVGDTVKIDGALLGGTTVTDDLSITIGTASPITAGGDTPGSDNHIELDMADYMSVCSVTEWSLSLSKDQQTSQLCLALLALAAVQRLLLSVSRWAPSSTVRARCQSSLPMTPHQWVSVFWLTPSWWIQLLTPSFISTLYPALVLLMTPHLLTLKAR